MSEHRFDQITQTLASNDSRRGILKSLGGGALGIVLTGLTVRAGSAQTTAARCLRNGKPCQRDRQCCSGECHRDVCRRDRRG